MIKLPQKNRDLKRYVMWKFARRVIGYIAWLGIWIGGAVSYNLNHQTYPDERRIVGWRLVILIAAAAMTGFFIFRLWKLFTQRPFYGVIEKSGVSRSYSKSDDPGAGIEADFRLNTYLKVRKANGRCCRVRFEQKKGFYLYYYEGTPIVRFWGMTYPLSLAENGNQGQVCVACGRIQEAKNATVCEHCGLSIIVASDVKTINSSNA